MIANSDANAAFNAAFPSRPGHAHIPRSATSVGFDGRSDGSKNAEQYDFREPGSVNVTGDQPV
jgi:hypothetical protein